MVFNKGHKPHSTIGFKGTQITTYQKRMSKELAEAWKNKELILLFERIALLSPSVDDLKRIDQCLSEIEAINQ